MTLPRAADHHILMARLENEMKLTRKDRVTIMDGMVVTYESQDFEVSASRNGVLIQDHKRIKDAQQRDELFACVNRAFLQYMKLSRHGATLSECEIDKAIYGDSFLDMKYASKTEAD